MKSTLTRTLMCGIAEIAETCGVGERRVRQWLKTGAPIYRDPQSQKWLAHPDELWEWRKNHELQKNVK